MNKQIKAIVFASLIAILSGPVMADSDAADIRALKGQIEALQARVAALEARQTFTGFMPDFAERFHVMHRAGEAGDWAVASHELAEMKRMAAQSTGIDMEKGKMMQAMMGPSFDALEEAMEHGDPKKFDKALNQTISTCNACHTATGSDFVQVTLDARESLSLRHPHRLMAREVPGGHSHGEPAAMGGMMGSGSTEEAHHDDADTAPHGHEKPHDDTGKPAHKHN